ncbi:unnamed protein product [Arctia plantaginis]|uniref:Uncharacterized protein n=1 Tax=Arctia plantaginis TaxID=874455 RepID=A0A8S0YMD7_ARCPL|nr:unnamed protein product [Arctia plantaginis]
MAEGLTGFFYGRYSAWSRSFCVGVRTTLNAKELRQGIVQLERTNELQWKIRLTTQEIEVAGVVYGYFRPVIGDTNRIKTSRLANYLLAKKVMDGDIRDSELR